MQTVPFSPSGEPQQRRPEVISEGEREEMFLIFCLCFSIAVMGLLIVRIVQIKKLCDNTGHNLRNVIRYNKWIIAVGSIIILLSFPISIYLCLCLTDELYVGPILLVGCINLAAITADNLYGGLKKEIKEKNGKEDD